MNILQTISVGLHGSNSAKGMISFIWPIFILLALIQAKNINELVRPRHIPPVQARAFRFISAIQEPLNCSSSYAVVEMGVWGGFSAQFQLVAAEWMRVFAALDFKVPVLIVGKINGYSNGPECAGVNNQWTCFFHPVSTCHDMLLKEGTKIEPSKYKPNDEACVPPEFAHFGAAFWWGTVQTFIFNVKSFVEDYLSMQISRMNRERGFLLGLPMAGIHVRHGDKTIDGFKLHSLSEELGLLGRSRDCGVKDRAGRCFLHTDTSVVLLDLAVARARAHQTVLVRLNDIHNYNVTVHLWGGQATLQAQYIDELDSLRTHLSSRSHHHSHFVIRNSLGNQSIVMPLPVFIASDDSHVLQVASQQGHLSFLSPSKGVSQQTSTGGMIKHLLSHPEDGYNATLEIIADIFMLSRCSSLIGVSASQVFRMAVGMANASHSLRFWKALDLDQINRVKQLSAKYQVPFPEDFFKEP